MTECAIVSELDTSSREVDKAPVVLSREAGDAPIASLRSDLEFQDRYDGLIDIRDPYLVQVFSFPQSDVKIAEAFDGTKSANQVAALVAKPRSNVLRVAEEFETLHLLDTPEARNQAPVAENTTPHSLISTTTENLHILPQAQPKARWSCSACGACCHGLAVELTPEEEARIDPDQYRDLLGDEHFAENAFIDPDQPAARILRQDHDRNGACIFLADDGRCEVHARQGMAAKPDACQIFPHYVLQVPDGPPRLAMRVNCVTMYDSFESGAKVQSDAAHVLRILKTSYAYQVPKRAPFFGKSRSFAQVDRIREALAQQCEEHGLTPQTLQTIDRDHFEGRVERARSAYGKAMLAHIHEELNGDFEIEEGGLFEVVKKVPRGMAALEAMKAKQRPPKVSKRVQTFLQRQLQHVLFGGGPFNLPDAGVGFVGILLALEATMHAVGPRGKRSTAHAAFSGFVSPVNETTALAWPILDAVAPELAEQLRKER